ncbi:MAG: GntR family transcriptional regulator [Bacteroides sp.]|jgi:DNA-binding transcriptional regulator YhcF (GntR family)|nr:GntR family transcriptional regulator [Bacteroides sp.]
MEFNENQAIYLQIADYFCENILQRKWQQGEKIPSIREIAVQVEVNPNTAMRTFNYLQDKGIIFNKRGIGYFVADDGFDKTLELKKEQFVQEDLPQVFRTLEMLRMDFKNLEKLYESYRQQNQN